MTLSKMGKKSSYLKTRQTDVIQTKWCEAKGWKLGGEISGLLTSVFTSKQTRGKWRDWKNA